MHLLLVHASNQMKNINYDKQRLHPEDNDSDRKPDVYRHHFSSRFQAWNHQMVPMGPILCAKIVSSSMNLSPRWHTWHRSDIKTVKPACSFCQSIKIKRFCPFASVWLQKMFIQTIIHYHYCFHNKSLYKLKPSTELIFSIGIPVA